MESNYSLADIKAATDGNEEFGGGWFWIVVLFLFMFGFNGNGWGNNNNALTRAELTEGFNFNQLDNAVRNMQQGLCEGLASQNTTMLQGFNGITNAMNCGFNNVNSNIAALSAQSAQCCCETNRNIDSLKAENYKNTCEITNAVHAEGEATRALITENTIQNLRDTLAERDRDLLASNLLSAQQNQTQNLISSLRPFPIPAYPTCSPYTSAANTCGCGCGV